MMRFIALINDAGVVQRILKHLKVWDPIPDPALLSGHDPVSAMTTCIAETLAFLKAGPKGEALFKSQRKKCDLRHTFAVK